MSRRNEHDALVIVLDVGRSVSELNVGENRSFFDQSKDCVSWILQRKLIGKSKDHIALVLMGTDETDNRLDQDVYKNIACKFDFQTASWDMLRFIENEVKTTNKTSDWINALVVSMDLLKSHEEENSCLTKRIVIFSDFTNPATDELSYILRAIKKKEIGITIIGPEVNPQDDENEEPPAKRYRSTNGAEKTEARIRGEQLIAEMSKKLEGLIQLSTFDRALKQLSSYVKKSVQLRPWNAVLDIGEVEIKISAYKKTDTKFEKKFDTRYLKPSDPSQPSTSASAPIDTQESVSVLKDKVMHYSHQNEQTNEIEEVAVQEGEITEGYKYGTTIVPFSSTDKENLGYKSGPKSLSILGFVSKSTFPFHLLTGECVYVITGRDRDEHSETALSAVIQAMHEENYVAVARRVYSEDRGLSLNILLPVVDEVDGAGGETYFKECLLLIELAFEEDVRSLEFGSLEPIAKTITPEQYACVDKLIDEMDLMTADRNENGEPCEALEWSDLHEIKNQFFQYCVIQRGLHPDRPVPKELPARFKEFVTLPKSLIQKNKNLGLALKQLFTIQVKEEKKPDVNGKNVVGQKIDNDSRVKVDVFARVKKDDEASTSANGLHDNDMISDSLELSEPTLENDFKRLFNKKEPPKETAIDNLIKYYLEDMGSSKDEIINVLRDCIKNIRQRGVSGVPEDYNFWLIKFKRFCSEKGGLWLEIWEVIVSDNLGLISNKENKNSRATEDEADQFLRSKITPSPVVQTPKKVPEYGTIPESADAAEKNEAMDMLF